MYSSMKKVLVGIGSNKAYDGKSPLEILFCACTELEKVLENTVFSSVYRTRAMYVENQDDFYNMAATGFVSDDFDAYDFLEILNKIEAKYGRNRKNEIRFGPRPLDLDIEYFGEETFDTPKLQVPHPRLKERAFVLIPSLEILNKSADDKLRNQFSEYLSQLEKNGQADGIEKLGGIKYGTISDNGSC